MRVAESQVIVTPIELEWEGFVTLEIFNTTPQPAKVYANEGVCPILFFRSDEACERYFSRGGAVCRLQSFCPGIGSVECLRTAILNQSTSDWCPMNR
jgi:hypothetical protein